MDVKVGSGAFMPTAEKSAELARSIVDVGNGAGMKTTAILTDMNQSLAPCAQCARSGVRDRLFDGQVASGAPA